MNRELLVRDLFPNGVPRLWCPLVTHFSRAAAPDPDRIARHLASIQAEVRGILVPGSTGEGWAMSDADVLSVLDAVFDAAVANGQKLLIGVLKTTKDAMLSCIEKTVAHLKGRIGAASWREASGRCGVVGFTVCPPSGAELPQDRIHADLAEVLALGYPTALYQLPQVTKNEMSPSTVASLANRFSNFFLFKDTSGRDAVATSGIDLGGVFLVRGAEGRYASWPKTAGGPYDGFLLSTANGFADTLARIVALTDAGNTAEAGRLSGALDKTVAELFALVGDFPAGNAFANANKLVDHLRGWGATAEDQAMPLLYGGERLPAAWVPAARAILAKHGVKLGRPYMVDRA